jgi:two-component system chemotaxis response regulator CheY
MKRILVVDDAATVRLYHLNILKEAGYNVEQAVNGLEALEKALQMPYDLYLVDVNMPKLDGYGFLKELRLQDMPQVPAIMVSTESSDRDRVRAYAAGANLYIVKPTKPDLLLASVALLLGEKL